MNLLATDSRSKSHHILKNVVTAMLIVYVHCAINGNCAHKKYAIFFTMSWFCAYWFIRSEHFPCESNKQTWKITSHGLVFEIIHWIFATHSLQLGMNLWYLIRNTTYSVRLVTVKLKYAKYRRDLSFMVSIFFFLLTATKINLVSEQTLSI